MDQDRQKMEHSPETETEEKQEGRSLFEWIQALTVSVLFVVLMFTFVARITGVEGTSMIPTLQEGDRLLVLADYLCDYQVGDIVIAFKESFYPDPIVKRIIAVEGQTVDIDFTEGVVYVDGSGPG